MSDQFELNAEVREDIGKGASRRLRRLADNVPAIIYGGEDPQPLTLIRKDLEKALENEAFYSHVLTINVGKTSRKPSSRTCSVTPPRTASCTPTSCASMTSRVKVHVPIHFLNEETLRRREDGRRYRPAPGY